MPSSDYDHPYHGQLLAIAQHNDYRPEDVVKLTVPQLLVLLDLEDNELDDVDKLLSGVAAWMRLSDWVPAKTTEQLMDDARAKLEADYPNATAAQLATVSMESTSLEAQAAHRKWLRELTTAEDEVKRVDDMKARYEDWKAAGYPYGGLDAEGSIATDSG